MVEETLFSSLRSPLSAAQGIFIFLPEEPSFDQVASALGLSLSLKKAGKTLSVNCPTEMKVEYSDLVGINQIQTKLAGRNLVISFEYLEDAIEKVSYNIEENKFNLVVQPKVGSPPLSSDRVAYSYSGGQADLIFTVGVQDLNELGDLYRRSKPFFESQKIIDVDLSPRTKRYAQKELILAVSSFSELVARLLSRLGLPVDGDIANNLYLGIEETTEGFSSASVGAGTFEAAAFCLRAAGKVDFAPLG